MKPPARPRIAACRSAGILFAAVALTGPASAAPPTFAQSAESVDAYDYVEVSATVPAPRVANPFTEASLTGWFENTAGGPRWTVEGFADADDGSVYRIRFMPPAAGEYRYAVTYTAPAAPATFAGSFHATDGHRRGLLRV